MKRYTYTTMALLISGALSTQSVALEVDREVKPRITVGGRVIATLDSYDWDSNTSKEDEINTEDSTIMTRFDKRMFEDGVAGGVLAFKEHEDKLLFNQLNAFYWNQDFQTKLGRTRLRNFLVEFPLVREDDDFLSYTHVGNASSNDEFDQKYADLLSFDWFVDKKVQSVGLWAGTRRNGDGVAAPDGLDSYGVSYVYEQPEPYQYLKTVRHAGIALDAQKVRIGATEEWMNAFIAGIEFNLNDSPLSNWAMGLQAISNEGAGTITSADILHSNANAVMNRARAKSNALVASLRYTKRPNLLTRWQASVNLGYKDYSDVNDATQWSIAPNVVYRIGQGVDLLGQAVYTDYGAGLGGGSDTTIQFGIAFSLEATYNDNIGERDSILNLEHGYIK